ncbi:CRISPR-associated protein Cas3 [Rhizobium rhizosphaerae]|uniref:CRISPR-associated protein Cas3 n=1 Tax=Xaviernesmea rhizosphaerae TaxID=1672749 RepID=A0A1Q9AQ35_9HYPH|nr:CRISPR-associated helicase/endonuclease Cas3 [Xaviernesmea rhizosphaerae]OLP57522.1 CRISPR-associated protein Cas3 [Xaviernesmea rhizosphaerae]
MQFYGHSDKETPRDGWQTLVDHLASVAEMAGGFARASGLEQAAFIAGLFHDLGKYDPAFQAYIAGIGESVDHSTAGARVLCDLAQGRDKAMAEIIAYAILGHHAGLPDRLNETGACFDMRMKKPLFLDPAWQAELGPDVARQIDGLARALPQPVDKDLQRYAFTLSFLGRMIFSCLVDADFKDTESFYVSLGQRAVDRDWPRLQGLLPGFQARFDAHMGRFASRAVASETSQTLNALRADILSHVRAGAAKGPGFFTLTVPTGGGKTLASLGFALDHAGIHGHDRIIYAIPFTSIIDQTSAIFRSVLGEEHVLEHHANIDEERFDARERRDKLKLAMEDWAAPVVITTNVQLFESLFSARPSRSRKLHNIANSIIILDEAQTLPRSLLLPVMQSLEELVLRYGCTVVLCTATQPALARREGFELGLPLDADRELAPDPEGLARQLARTRIRHQGVLDDAALVETLGVREQMLVIVNSRRHALDLYRQAKAANLDGLVHLTTRQYASDRRRILAEVRRRLHDGLPCRLIATSLIEAGVDVDFPAALRAEAGLDQIIQAAGRVNREGKRPRDDSVVTVFTPADHKPPREIAGLIGDMKRIIDKHPDLTAPAAIADYFGEVYWRVGRVGLDAKDILGRFNLASGGTDFAYRKVGEDFRMIESGLAPVIIAIEDEAKLWVDKLGLADVPSGLLARKLQAFTVQVPPKARERLRVCGHVAFVAPHLRGDQFAVLQKASLYDPQLGLIWEDADYLAAEDLLW